MSLPADTIMIDVCSRPPLWPHIGNILTAMQGAAEVLDLDGRLAT
ncbi:MAG: hypothetical protein BroJett015_18450 [Chloroflexota bacterium]|nr:MAG: hypothetical protein BroJett015_18450 [Chloroflexota bacterium]